MGKIFSSLKKLPTSSAILIAIIWWSVLYLGSNHFGGGLPRTLPFIFGEEKIPFVLFSVIIYLTSGVELFAGAYIERKDIHRFVMGFMLVTLVCAVFFIFFPTAYPRPETVPVSDKVWLWLYTHFVTAFDSPKNAFPSVHIASAVYVACVASRHGRWYGFLFFVWSLAIAVSTLTLKQHYVVDIGGGMVIGTAVFAYMYYGRALKNGG